MGEEGELFCFNGVDGTTGSYLSPPATSGELIRLAFGEGFDQRPDEQVDAHLRNKLRFFHDRATQQAFGPKEGVDPTDLAQAGWGIVFASAPGDASCAIREALGELLALRKEECGPRYREYIGPDAYRTEERADQFLARLGVGPGPADPDKVPYYLLLVGDPDAIPYRFQYELDVQYAVGRIHFDTLEEYAAYARSVVEVERGDVELPRRAAFFGTQNADDRATRMSAIQLVEPLAEWMSQWLERDPSRPAWEIVRIREAEATKKRLESILGGSETPALLFTASHGMGFPCGDERQAPHQGALLCSDWPGPRKWGKSIPQDFYVAADDITNDARLRGLIAFHYACYSAGTPARNAYARMSGSAATRIAPSPFLARLPCRLLGHAKGGALAVIGNVERVWSSSFHWPRAGTQLSAFESTLERILEGQRVGFAMEYFNMRYAELSTKLSNELDDIDNGAAPDPLRLVDLWTHNNDARGYIVLGDPAVRLPFTPPSPAPAEPVASVVELPPGAEASDGPTAPLPASLDTPAPCTGLAAVRDALTAELLLLLKDTAGFEVATYESDGVADAEFSPSARRFLQHATKRFITRVLPSGDVHTCAPAVVDEAAFARHASMVERALAERRKRIEGLVAAIARLAGDRLS